MAASSAINYTLRPAKTAERKMIVEMLARLTYFHPLAEYQYVGFGAAYFADFRLIHRALGISTMLSIEKDTFALARYEANKPYETVRVVGGWALDVLPEAVDWTRPVIAWLDFDGALHSDRLDEIAAVVDRALEGSVVLITVNAQPPRRLVGAAKQFADAVGASNLPSMPTDLQLGNWGTATLSREAVNMAITHVLRERNATVGPEEKLEFEQLMNFRYDDEAKMLTVGGVIFRHDQREIFDTCRFDRFDQYRPDADAFRLSVPRLTHREIRALDALLPADPDTLELAGVPAADIKRYAAIYRYFPVFADVDV